MQTELVDRARRGDREAFGVLAGGAVDRLYGIARLILRDTELAEDATQDALVRAWRDLPTLRDVERFDAWLYRLLVRSCADIGRHRRRWRAELTVLPIEPAEPDRASELADRDQLERGLRRLNDAQRTILILHFYIGLSPARRPKLSKSPSGPPSPGSTTPSRRSARPSRPTSARGRRPAGGPDGMSANHDLERRLADFYATRHRRGHPTGCSRRSSPPSKSPTAARGVRMPRRIQNMNTYAKVAIAAVVVIAFGAVGLAVWRGGAPAGPGVVTPTASPTSGPSGSPSSELTESFASSVHGISVSYPADWSAEPATVPWSTGGVPGLVDGARDLIADGAANESFIGLASQPLRGKAGVQWANDLLADPDGFCQPPTEPITVAGAPGVFARCSDIETGTNGQLALAWGGPRLLDRALPDRRSNVVRSRSGRVELRPEDAVDGSAPPLTSTFTSPRYGLTLSYPDGWVVRRTGTEPWTTGVPTHDDDFGDVINAGPVVENNRNDQAFIAVASQPLGGTDGGQWATELLGVRRVGQPVQPTARDHNRRISGRRGHGLWERSCRARMDSGSRLLDPHLRSGRSTWYTNAAWLDEFVAAIQLRPEDAVVP